MARGKRRKTPSRKSQRKQIEAILRLRYTKDAEIPDRRTYKQDLKRFLTFVENKPVDAFEHPFVVFMDYFIFEGNDGKWYTPSGIYLDRPYSDTGLTAYYEVIAENATCVPLADSYRQCNIGAERLGRFAHAVGAQVVLPVKQASVYRNPQSSYLLAVGGERRSRYRCSQDFVIPKLETILKKPSMGISKLVWRTMCECPFNNFLRAKHGKNASWGSLDADSQLAHVLKLRRWVPQGKGSFVRPSRASLESLPDDFVWHPDWPWLEAVGFDKRMLKELAERHQKVNHWFDALKPKLRNSIFNLLDNSPGALS